MIRPRTAAVAATALLLAGTATADDSLAQIVDRTSRWVQRLEQDFITVIADETYDQVISSRALPGVRTGLGRRRIQSELLFMRGGDPPDWLAVRNVRSFADEDGTRVEVPNSHDRLQHAVESGGGRAALRRLADESARFNIGRVARNFNTPTLVLQFLDAGHRDRFKFTLQGSETIGGDETWRVAYEERDHPTIIKANGRDTRLSGLLWARRSDGAVLRTRMTLIAVPHGPFSGITTTVTVDYALDAKLGTVVPVRMNEQYLERDGDERIEGTAVYSNYRVFETSGRLITP